jgi:hypothetical protein
VPESRQFSFGGLADSSDFGNSSEGPIACAVPGSASSKNLNWLQLAYWWKNRTLSIKGVFGR